MVHRLLSACYRANEQAVRPPDPRVIAPLAPPHPARNCWKFAGDPRLGQLALVQRNNAQTAFRSCQFDSASVI